MSLTIVGLGPGTWETLTIEAAAILQAADTIYVRTGAHPSLEPIRERLSATRLETFDHLYETTNSAEQICSRIADEMAGIAARVDNAVFAVPGSPSIGEMTVRLLLERVKESDTPVRIVQGVSYIEPVLAAAGAQDTGWIEVLDASEVALLARENAVGEAPDQGHRIAWRAPVPTSPIVISCIRDRRTACGVKLWLSRYFPDDHDVVLVQAAGTPGGHARRVPLVELDRQSDIDHRSAVFVPALDDLDNIRTFSGLMNLTRRLRAPDGCPWDREQTHETLKPHLLEETYEVLDALDSGDPTLLAEEMGDLLFQITIHSQVAAERGEFTIEDVIQNIMTKLIGRHPHVFGDVELDSAQDVRHAWESFKQREKPKRTSVLEQIPRGLPALPQSNLMQKRASSVGFEWPSVHEVLDKVGEEIGELRQEVDRGARKATQREEFGDILFALVSVARHLRIDPEEALRLANRKFAGRFQYVERRVTATGKALRDLSPEELDLLWREAKTGTASA